MNEAQLLGEICDLLLKEFPQLQGVELSADTELISSGLLDSFALVNLIALLEEAYRVELDVEEIELEALESPGAIAALCLEALA